MVVHLGEDRLSDLFAVVLTQDDVTRGKPDPQPYLLAAERLGIAPAELLVFEDTDVGVASAKSAGAYVVGLTRTLGEAWAEDGIRVNGIAPGLVDTKMTKVTTANPKRLEGAIERIPLKRLGTPADMAGAALFLASPLSSYIVGQTLIVDGGLIL